MLKKAVEMINRFMLIFNVVVLILLLIWSLIGVWKVEYRVNFGYWQMLITFFVILAFNFLFTFGIAELYRRNLKITDLFADSEYTVDYVSGTVLFRKGEEGKLMYLIIQGKVELSLDGKVLEEVGPDGLFGEMAVVEHLPRTATARCISDCKLVEIDEKRFCTLFQQAPFFGKEVLRVISSRLRATRV